MTKKERLKLARLYCITMPPSDGQSYPQMVEKACQGGADMIQLRDKKLSVKELVFLGKQLKEICTRYNTLFIINDRLDVALACGADGVHLGQDDLSVTEARNQSLRSDFLIGCSTHSLEQALEAEKNGADYVGCGPIFSTPTKPGYKAVGLDLIQQYRKRLKIPFVAIGGIDAGNMDQVIQAGASCVAVVRSAFGEKDVQQAVRLLKGKLQK